MLKMLKADFYRIIKSKMLLILFIVNLCLVFSWHLLFPDHYSEYYGSLYSTMYSQTNMQLWIWIFIVPFAAKDLSSKYFKNLCPSYSQADRLFYILSKLIYIFAFCLLYALAQLAVNAVIGYAYNRDNFVIYDPERDNFTVGRFYLMYAAYTLNGVAAGTLTLFLCNLFGREYVVLAVLLAYMYFFSTAFYGIINDIVQNAFDPDFEIEFYTVYGQGRMSGQSMEDEKYLTMLFVSLGYTALFTLLSWLVFRRRSC